MQILAQAGLPSSLLGIGLIFVVRAVRSATAYIPVCLLVAEIVCAAVIGMGLFGLVIGRGRAALCRRRQIILGESGWSGFLGQFKHGIFVQHPDNFLMHVLRGELHQTNSLLQLRG